MSAPPRGIKLTNPRRSADGKSIEYTVRVARWRMALMVLSALRGMKATQRVEGVRPNDARRAAGLRELSDRPEKWPL